MAASTVQLQMDRPAIGQFPRIFQYKRRSTRRFPAGTWAMRVQATTSWNRMCKHRQQSSCSVLPRRTTTTRRPHRQDVSNDRPGRCSTVVRSTSFVPDGSITYDHVMMKVALKDNATIGMPVAAYDKTVTLVAIDLRQTTARPGIWWSSSKTVRSDVVVRWGAFH